MHESPSPQTLTVEEAATILRIGRTAAYALAREWRSTGGRSGLSVLQLGGSSGLDPPADAGSQATCASGVNSLDPEDDPTQRLPVRAACGREVERLGTRHDVGRPQERILALLRVLEVERDVDGAVPASLKNVCSGVGATSMTYPHVLPNALRSAACRPKPLRP